MLKLRQQAVVQFEYLIGCIISYKLRLKKVYKQI